MSSIAVAGDTSGVVTISAPAVAGTPTLTLPTTSGTIITTASSTGLDASVISSGTMATARLASGSATSSTYLRGDQTWATISSGATTLKYVTDSTDITLANISSSQSNVGSTFSVTIPTTGYIKISSFAGRIQWSSVADNVQMNLGIRIGSTNYWFNKINNNGTIDYQSMIGPTTGYQEQYGGAIRYINPSGAAYTNIVPALDITAMSVPTGTQTVQLIASYGNTFTGIGILKGTTTTTRVGIEFVSAS